jgi:hypothetical protein
MSTEVRTEQGQVSTMKTYALHVDERIKSWRTDFQQLIPSIHGHHTRGFE